jgi:hypothetical protein
MAGEIAVELVGGPRDGDIVKLEDPKTDDRFTVPCRNEHTGQKLTLVYEVETDPELDQENWAIYRGQERRSKKSGKPKPGAAANT